MFIFSSWKQGLAIAFACLNGCSSKKKTTEPVKQEIKAPEKKPTPPTVTLKTPEIEKEEKEDIVPKEISFETIYFDFDKSNIRADQRNAIDNNAQLMNRHETVKIRIEGHCDERGTEEYNMALGQRRADSVQSYLVDYGISSSRITTVSYGEMRPADSGHNEFAWAKNRRGEIIIVSK